MPADLEKINKNKERILSNIRIRGPSLPVQIARTIEVEPLFASAFLAELLAEKKISISKMKVGGSPLYLLPGQEPQLEKFIQYLNPKEREAFDLLKENKLLNDESQAPAIRVALRAIKDFAVPIRVHMNAEARLFWKHFLLSDEEIKSILEPISKREQEARDKLASETLKEVVKEQIQIPEQQEKAKETVPLQEQAKEQVQEQALEQVKEQALEQVKEQIPAKKQKRRKEKDKDAFLKELKPILAKKNLELIHILEYSNKEVIARVKSADKELLLFALNKKKVDEKAIKRAFKKSIPYNLPYTILSLSTPPKSLKEKHEMYSNLLSFDFIE